MSHEFWAIFKALIEIGGAVLFGWLGVSSLGSSIGAFSKTRMLLYFVFGLVFVFVFFFLTSLAVGTLLQRPLFAR